jgi:hypothetical protein
MCSNHLHILRGRLANRGWEQAQTICTDKLYKRFALFFILNGHHDDSSIKINLSELTGRFDKILQATGFVPSI